jgi:hypothetical protein
MSGKEVGAGSKPLEYDQVIEKLSLEVSAEGHTQGIELSEGTCTVSVVPTMGIRGATVGVPRAIAFAVTAEMTKHQTRAVPMAAPERAKCC